MDASAIGPSTQSSGAVSGAEPAAGQIAVGLALACAQSLLLARARETEDLTRDKTDETDAVVVALW
jgi:hypothetical protein